MFLPIHLIADSPSSLTANAPQTGQVFGISNSAFEALKLKGIDKSLIWRGVNPKKINNHC